jgi:hypothetical protein
MAVGHTHLAARPDRISTRRRIVLVVAALAILWLVLGFVRAPAIARDFLARESPGAVIDLKTVSVFPAIPPFFVVQLEGTVTLPDDAREGYAFGRILAVEPFTGFVISLASG